LKHNWVTGPLASRPDEFKSLGDRGTLRIWNIRENGEMVFTDQKLLEQQSKVFTWVIRKMGSNLLAGKSITSISLPVTIFEDISYLERLAISFEPAPLMLDRAFEAKDRLARMRWVVAYVISLGITYVVMKKPFNPILGETYSCLIDGCPYYAEQVSHHPPISNYMLFGRTFTVTGSVEPLQTLGFNTASGFNHGTHLIRFHDGD
jgi:hypothetical protein